jgi:hypothetical protein
MIVYFSTVRRKRPVREEEAGSGLDGEACAPNIPLFPVIPISVTIPIQGNSRGSRACSSAPGSYVGTYHTILVFDPELRLKRRISNRLFASIHEYARRRCHWSRPPPRLRPAGGPTRAR